MLRLALLVVQEETSPAANNLFIGSGSLFLHPDAALATRSRSIAGVGAFFMLCVVYDPDAPVRRFLCNPLLSFAGLLSYEWYLFHILFIGLSDRITGSELHGSYGKLLIRILFSFPMAFAFAMLVYRFFSLPILRWAHGVRRG